MKYSRTHLEELMRLSSASLIIPPDVSFSVENELTNPYAEMDREQMVQVITNLLKNGMEAMPRGGALRVNLSDKNDWMIIRIRDEGSGIAPGDLEKVFEPFYTTKGIGKGTGLGLATCYGIIKMHRGNIDVKSSTKSENGPRGTEFIIKLPRIVVPGS